MAKLLVDKKISSLILITIVGLIIGSLLGLLIEMLPGDVNVVRDLFLFNFVPISIGYPNPVLLDISAMKLQFGIQMNINVMSIIGVIVALWAYRWFR